VPYGVYDVAGNTGWVSGAEMAAIDITPHAFHGEWNCTIQPNPE